MLKVVQVPQVLKVRKAKWVLKVVQVLKALKVRKVK